MALVEPGLNNMNLVFHISEDGSEIELVHYIIWLLSCYKGRTGKK